ncbi:hypothetical protein F5877DRAFT_78705 [Lentinula edodes]|nr:hypothetical protein F5877DRAFT_78705 [Lentinula edodes]
MSKRPLEEENVYINAAVIALQNVTSYAIGFNGDNGMSKFITKVAGLPTVDQDLPKAIYREFDDPPNIDLLQKFETLSTELKLFTTFPHSKTQSIKALILFLSLNRVVILRLIPKFLAFMQKLGVTSGHTWTQHKGEIVQSQIVPANYKSTEDTEAYLYPGNCAGISESLHYVCLEQMNQVASALQTPILADNVIGEEYIWLREMLEKMDDRGFVVIYFYTVLSGNFQRPSNSIMTVI